jgi:multiple sugar transport system substrate-binding protein
MRHKILMVAAALGLGLGVGAGTTPASAQDLVVAATSGAQFDAISLTAKEFTSATGAEIEIVESPYNNLFAKLNTNCTTRSGSFDVVMMDDPWFQGFADNNCLVKLTDYFLADGTDGPDSDFLAKSLAVCRNPYATGAYYCLPYVGNAQMFFYNPVVFAEHGLEGNLDTWEKVIEIGTKITAAGDGDTFGYVLRGVEGNPVVAQFMPVLWSYGGRMFDDAGNPQVNSPEVLQALEVFLRLRDISPPGAESMDTDELATYLLQGAAMSSVNWPNWVATFEDPESSRVVGKITHTRIPNGTKAGSSEIGHWMLGISAESDNKQLAFDFIKFATSAEQVKKSVAVGNPPVRFSVFTDTELTSQDEFRYYPVLMDAIAFSTPRPRHARWFEVENEFGIQLSKAVAGVLTPDQALDAAQKGITELLAR